MGKALEFNDAEFDTDVLQSAEPVLVDFWAPWCGPCRQIAPLIEELAVQYEGKVKVGKINTDDNPETAQRYGVLNIPTLILFKDGEIADRFIGWYQNQNLKTPCSRFNYGLLANRKFAPGDFFRRFS